VQRVTNSACASATITLFGSQLANAMNDKYLIKLHWRDLDATYDFLKSGISKSNN
jgi:hypothetical protein